MKTHLNLIAGAAAVLSLGLASVSAADCGHDHAKSAGHQKVSEEAGKQAVAEVKAMDIVETAVAAGSFKTLVAAVQAAGLVETLQGEGPFTVFAPTDDAFAKLPEGTIAELLKPENKEKLQAILTYHVVPGKVTSADVVKLESAATVQGQALSISSADGKVLVDNAQVTQVDIMAANGVIHVIDSVVLPREM